MHRVRLGEISFINALPFAMADSRVGDIAIQKTIAAPTRLNSAMLAGELDVSPVSSAFYLRHRERFTLLEGLSISAEEPVRSVLLFLPQDPGSFTPDTRIAVPDTSETSIALMRYILYQETGIPCFTELQTYPPGEGDTMLDAGLPVLAIGNEALTMVEARPETPCLDLAQAWQALTGLPFVFAVWIAQRNWAEANPDTLQVLHTRLVKQKNRFYQDPEVQQRIIDQAHQQCPHLSPLLLTHYFTRALTYNLDRRHLDALTWFQHILDWLDNDNRHNGNGDRTPLSIELLHR